MGGNDMFLVKLNAAGQFIWKKTYGGLGDDNGRTLGIDTENNIIITGSFRDSIHFDSHFFSNTAGSNFFLTKLDSAGNISWATNGLSSFHNGSAIHVEKNGIIDVIIKSCMPGCEGSSTCVSRFKSDGTMFSNHYEYGMYTDVYEFSADDSSNIYVIYNSGDHYGTWPVLTKYDSVMAPKWSVELDDDYEGYSFSVGLSIDSIGNSYVAGFIDPEEGNTTNFDNDILTVNGGRDLIVVKIDRTGNFSWHKTATGSGSENPKAMCIDKSGNCYLTGVANGNAVFDNHILFPSGNWWEMFVAKLNPTYVQVTNQTNVLCNGQCNGTATAISNGSTPPYTYLWAPGGETTEQKTNMCAGTYTCTITDADSNITYNVVTIKQPTPLLLSQTHTNVLCSGQCTGTILLTASGGKPPYTYSGITSGLCAGTYTYTVTDTNGCISSTSAAITQPIAINAGITAESTTTSINSNTDLLTGTPAGGIFSGTGVSGTNFNPSAAGLGTWTITYTYTNGSGCTDTATTNITVNLSTDVTTNAVKEANWEVYPNPTSGIFTLNIKTKTADTKICVYDVLGNCVYDKVSIKNCKVEIDLSNQPKGIYNMEIESQGESVMKKIVLQ